MDPSVAREALSLLPKSQFFVCTPMIVDNSRLIGSEFVISVKSSVVAELSSLSGTAIGTGKRDRERGKSTQSHDDSCGDRTAGSMISRTWNLLIREGDSCSLRISSVY